MSGKFLHQLAILVGLFALVFAFAQPALADPPTKAVLTFREVVDELLTFCEGFDIIHRHVLTLTVTTFFDKDGNPRLFKAHFVHVGTFENSETGKVGQNTVVFTRFTDPNELTDTFVGMPFRIIIRGEGSDDVQDTGKIVFDLVTGAVVFEGGPHDFKDMGFFLDLCDFMA